MSAKVELIELRSACRAWSISRRTASRWIAAGLAPMPIRNGTHKSVLLSHEVTALVGARLAGWTDDEVRRLVAQLMAKRPMVAAELLAEAA